jgi:hypothetical protein
MAETFIIVKDQFPALHAWVDCPFEEVSFLRTPHRHVFHVTVKVKVDHDDRAVEFFMLKNTLSSLLHDLFAHRDLGSKSCEMLCHDIKDSLKLNYDEGPLNIHSISVFEDNENGAEVVFWPTTTD